MSREKREPPPPIRACAECGEDFRPALDETDRMVCSHCLMGGRVERAPVDESKGRIAVWGCGISVAAVVAGGFFGAFWMDAAPVTGALMFMFVFGFISCMIVSLLGGDYGMK